MFYVRSCKKRWVLEFEFFLCYELRFTQEKITFPTRENDGISGITEPDKMLGFFQAQVTCLKCFHFFLIDAPRIFFIVVHIHKSIRFSVLNQYFATCNILNNLRGKFLRPCRQIPKKEKRPNIRCEIKVCILLCANRFRTLHLVCYPPSCHHLLLIKTYEEYLRCKNLPSAILLPGKSANFLI